MVKGLDCSTAVYMARTKRSSDSDGDVQRSSDSGGDVDGDVKNALNSSGSSDSDETVEEHVPSWSHQDGLFGTRACRPAAGQGCSALERVERRRGPPPRYGPP